MGKAQLFIQLTDAAVQAGEHVRGHVFLDVSKEIQGSEMTLSLHGEEQTEVVYSTNTNGKNHRTTARDSHTIVRINIPVDHNSLFQNGKRISRGQYRLPFDVELPGSLPSSMMHHSGGDSCAIVYKMKAILKGSGVLWNYSCEQPVHVKAQPKPVERTPFISQPDTQAVNLLCCFNRGTVSLGAKLDCTHLERGTTTGVSVACHNNSTVTIQTVQARLIERVKWTAGSHSSSSNVNLDLFVFNKNMKGTERQIAAGKSRVDLNQIYQKIVNGTNAGSLTLPPRALNSYNGSLIRVEHSVVVTIDTPCCIDNPTIYIPCLVTEHTIASEVVIAPAVLMTHPTEEIPMASASVVTTSVVYATSSMAVYGNKPELDIAVLPTPSAPMEPFDSSPSVSRLLKDMENCITGVEILEKRVVEPSWQPLFTALRPDEYYKILRGLASDFDQVKVAVMLARIVSVFSCDHVVLALRAVTEWNRPSIIEQLIPFCRDFPNNHSKIRNELTDWERIVTERAFSNALNYG